MHVVAENGLAVHDTELNQGPSPAKPRLHSDDTLKETSKQRLGIIVERKSATHLHALRVQAVEKVPKSASSLLTSTRLEPRSLHQSRAISEARSTGAKGEPARVRSTISLSSTCTITEREQRQPTKASLHRPALRAVAKAEARPISSLPLKIVDNSVHNIPSGTLQLLSEGVDRRRNSTN